MKGEPRVISVPAAVGETPHSSPVLLIHRSAWKDDFPNLALTGVWEGRFEGLQGASTIPEVAARIPALVGEFPERSHYTVGQDGWEEVADYALEWATEHAAARPAS